jgi:hypothetical protein
MTRTKKLDAVTQNLLDATHAYLEAQDDKGVFRGSGLELAEISVLSALTNAVGGERVTCEVRLGLEQPRKD